MYKILLTIMWTYRKYVYYTNIFTVPTLTISIYENIFVETDSIGVRLKQCMICNCPIKYHEQQFDGDCALYIKMYGTHNNRLC